MMFYRLFSIGQSSKFMFPHFFFFCFCFFNESFLILISTHTQGNFFKTTQAIFQSTNSCVFSYFVWTALCFIIIFFFFTIKILAWFFSCSSKRYQLLLFKRQRFIYNVKSQKNRFITILTCIFICLSIY